MNKYTQQNIRLLFYHVLWLANVKPVREEGGALNNEYSSIYVVIQTVSAHK